MSREVGEPGLELGPSPPWSLGAPLRKRMHLCGGRGDWDGEVLPDPAPQPKLWALWPRSPERNQLYQPSPP